MTTFSLDTTMSEIEAVYPFARATLHAQFHVGGCASCGFEPHESLDEVAKKHGKDPVLMLEVLNKGYSDTKNAEIEPTKAAEYLNKPDVLFVDVREAWEHTLCNMGPNSILMSEKTMPLIFEKAAQVKQVIVYCHHGVRSLNAALYMRQNGIPNAVSLKGGIDRYAQIVDPSLPRY
ncbi:MAG: hypothetical protein RIR26_2314 [Pseudomonadota bacterium]|jgi:rhodanese-related sulfurtransferase